jgi:hypothetical protein
LTRDDPPMQSDWETVLSAAAFVRRIVPDAILATVPATSSVDERLYDVDEKMIADLKRRYAIILTDLERVSGWKTAGKGRIGRIYANFQGVETGIFDLARAAPLETTLEKGPWGEIAVPTLTEMLRIKAWLVISRNATRDYLDAAALAERLGLKAAVRALSTLDGLYPQTNRASALQQAAKQLASPRPFDLADGYLSPYRVIEPPEVRWIDVQQRCRGLAADLMLALERAVEKPTVNTPNALNGATQGRES